MKENTYSTPETRVYIIKPVQMLCTSPKDNGIVYMIRDEEDEI